MNITQIAQAELIRRADAAQASLDAMRSSTKRGDCAADYNRRLAPWLAIAIRCGVDITRIAPDYAADIEEWRKSATSSLARAVVADRIASLAECRAELARARDVVVQRASAAAGTPAFDERVQVAGAIVALALHMGCSPYLAQPMEKAA